MGNFPSQQIADVSGDFVGETVACLQDLAKQGIPQTDAELKERIDTYFTFCAENSFRPGIESLCLSLSTSRQNFWVWCGGGGGKSKEWQQTCRQAKHCIRAFLEACGLNGRINPATLIFALKNWGNYTDSVTLEVAENNDRELISHEFPIFDLPTIETEEKRQ